VSSGQPIGMGSVEFSNRLAGKIEQPGSIRFRDEQ
jgi:hypothetical protein